MQKRLLTSRTFRGIVSDMDAVQVLMALVLALVAGGNGDQQVTFHLPPQTFAWDVEIYGAANVSTEFPLDLYAIQEGTPGALYIGQCGAPVHNVSGNMSYCMTTNRLVAQRRQVSLIVDTEFQTDWYVHFNTYRSHVLYLPSVSRNAAQSNPVAALAYP